MACVNTAAAYYKRTAYSSLTSNIATTSDVSVISLGLGCNTADCLDERHQTKEAQLQLTILLEHHATAHDQLVQPAIETQ